MLIIVCGLPGTGKSTLAKHLSSDLGGEILRTDIIRRELFKDASLEEVLKAEDPMQYDLERIFDRQRSIPDYYQRMIWKQKMMVYDELIRRAEALLLRRSNVILDGTFYKRSLRERIYAVSKRLNVPAYLIECVCPERAIKERLRERRNVRDSVSNVRKMQIYYKVKRSYEPPTSDKIPTIIFDTLSEKVKVRNVGAEDEGLKEIMQSIRRLIGKYSLK